MNLWVDFHSHIYSVYDLRKTLDFVVKLKTSPLALFLTERADCDYFNLLLEKKVDLLADYQIEIIDKNCCKLNDRIFFFRGRQYATEEGIEVLALFCSANIPDKLPAKVYSEAILEAGGLIAFSWAFGKWRGPRSALIESLALKYGPKQVLLLDSRLRPAILPLPDVFDKLQPKGFKIFAGSDPLPLRWHEKNLASYVNLFELPELNISEINSQRLSEVILEDKSSVVVGKRSGIFEFIGDQVSLRIC